VQAAEKADYVSFGSGGGSQADPHAEGTGADPRMAGAAAAADPRRMAMPYLDQESH
jgi:hypothetical protein